MKKLLFMCMLSAVVSGAYAQKTKNVKIGVEFGQGMVVGNYNNGWNIRQDAGAYLYDDSKFSSSTVYAESNFFYLGIKPQVSLWNNRINLYSGLRFTMFNGNLGNKRGNKTFYFRAENPNAIEFYRISFINEKRGYLSVPFEMSYNVFWIKLRAPNASISFYAKAGAEVGFSILSKQRVGFVSPTMQSHENEVLGSARKLNNFYSTFYVTTGAQLTLGNGMQFNMEGIVPSKLLTKNNNSIIEPDILSGAQLSLQFPISMFIKTN